MHILDIHTHNQAVKPETVIRSIHPVEFSAANSGYYSIGFHPNSVKDGSDMTVGYERMEQEAAHKNVLAIGETGIDKIIAKKYNSIETQEELFLKQAAIAERLNKPVIIHCVGAFGEMIQYKQKIKPRVPWIIHGYRKSKELAGQLIQHGFYLSYGYHYHADALVTTPPDRMFFETDDSEDSIYNIYHKAAKDLGIDKKVLIETVQNNIQKVFFSTLKSSYASNI